MVTEWNKPVRRKVHIPDRGDFVVTIEQDGVSIRKARHRRAIKLPFDAFARKGLELEGYLLSAKEWADPIKTLGKLRRLRRIKD